jgi:hypothetical protein
MQGTGGGEGGGGGGTGDLQLATHETSCAEQANPQAASSPHADMQSAHAWTQPQASASLI